MKISLVIICPILFLAIFLVRASSVHHCTDLHDSRRLVNDSQSAISQIERQLKRMKVISFEKVSFVEGGGVFAKRVGQREIWVIHENTCFAFLYKKNRRWEFVGKTAWIP